MRYLVLSDIHANLEALEAVLAEAAGRYDEILCLGDLVGYGADPNAVTEWVREHATRVIRGNHDKACCGLEDPVSFNPLARAAVEWTAAQLTAENNEYLRQLPKGPAELPELTLAHGSIRDEDEYVIDLREAFENLAAAAGRLVFFGHTHVQGGFVLSALRYGGGVVEPGSPSSMRIRDGGSYLLNPGSVGQPRDLVWQAGYALYDSANREVEFRRCPYNLATAQRKIREAGLPEALADRLALGR